MFNHNMSDEQLDHLKYVMEVCANGSLTDDVPVLCLHGPYLSGGTGTFRSLTVPVSWSLQTRGTKFSAA